MIFKIAYRLATIMIIWPFVIFTAILILLLRPFVHIGFLPIHHKYLGSFRESLIFKIAQTFFEEGIFTPFAILLVLLILILRPFVLIRLVPIYNAYMGHFLGNVEMYLCERDSGLHSPKTFDLLFYFHRITCNMFIKMKWERIFKEYGLFVLPTIFSGLMVKTHYILSLHSEFAAHITHNWDSDPQGFLQNAKVHLTFTEEEEKKGMEALENFGLPDNVEFICIYSREETSFEPHNHRNGNILNFLPAAEEMTRRGYYVFRMGVLKTNPLQGINNPKIIDFPFTGKRTDFLDVYLWARCKFSIASPSGPTGVPYAMRRPMVYVNYIPLPQMTFLNLNHLVLPKKIFIRHLNRYATFVEQSLFEALCIQQGWRPSSNYSDSGLDVVENTPQEILDIAIEMDDRLKGIHLTSQDDEELQAQCRAFFSSLYPQHTVERQYRIGSNFLRENRNRMDLV